MPVKTKKPLPKKKSHSKAKAKKPTLRSVKPFSKPKLEAKAPEGSSILWKILAERKRREEKFPAKLPGSNPTSNHRGTQYPQHSGKHSQFAKYAGPRRKAA